MPILDLFSIARGLKAGQDAYTRGQKEQADQYWTEIENTLKMAQSAQNLKFGAEKHPIEVAGMGLTNRLNEAEAKSAEQKFADTQETRKYIEQKGGQPYAQMEAGRYLTKTAEEQVTSELSIREAQEKLPYVQLLTQLNVDSKRIGMLTDRANLFLLKAKTQELIDAQKNLGKDLSFTEALKQAAYGIIAETERLPSIAHVEARRLTEERKMNLAQEDRAKGRYNIDVTANQEKPVLEAADRAEQVLDKIRILSSALDINSLNAIISNEANKEKFPMFYNALSGGMTSADAQKNALISYLNELNGIAYNYGNIDLSQRILRAKSNAQTLFDSWWKIAQKDNPNPTRRTYSMPRTPTKKEMTPEQINKLRF